MKGWQSMVFAVTFYTFRACCFLNDSFCWSTIITYLSHDFQLIWDLGSSRMKGIFHGLETWLVPGHRTFARGSLPTDLKLWANEKLSELQRLQGAALGKWHWKMASCHIGKIN